MHCQQDQCILFLLEMNLLYLCYNNHQLEITIIFFF
jgi:hypothetical protein